MNIKRTTYLIDWLGFEHKTEQTFNWDKEVWSSKLSRLKERYANYSLGVKVDEQGTFSIEWKDGFTCYNWSE